MTHSITDSTQIAKSVLLTPGSLEINDLEKILGSLTGHAVDSADLFLQSIQKESWSLEEGLVKGGGFSTVCGFGLRVISGEKTGFAYADLINLPTLSQAAHTAKSIVHSPSSGSLKQIHSVAPNALYPPMNPINVLSEDQKVAFLKQLDEKARKKSKTVKEVFIHLSSQYEVILLINSEGLLVTDIRPLATLSIRVLVEKGGIFESGSSGGGSRLGYEVLMEKAESYVDKAVRQANLNLSSEPAPAGCLPVVLGAGWPAVLLHEAIGHGLEGDFNRKGSSAFSGQLGKRVAAPECTIVDNGTLAYRPGSLNFDDEGTVTQSTVLVENGILKNYMQDKHNAHLMKMKATGNGRRESYASPPLPRMTNTYLLPGKYEPAEIIASVKKGLYAVDFSGGQVDITSGKFVFSTREAYLIENGKITRPVKGATLIGNGPDVLTKVSMVGHDLAFDEGLGLCGKAGQTVPVGVGQPTLKVDSLTVGGQSL